jgi:hypothetical protein
MKPADLTTLPEPLTPPDCDLRGLPYMPLDVIRLIDSDMFAETTGDEFKAAVALWCKSWTQVPAASLPNKDMVLAHLSGNAAKWKRIKEGAMRGWILCSDDRWYHPVVAEKALAALPGREEFNHKRSAEAERKAREREDRKALFEMLRGHGVVPDWNVSTKALRALAAQQLSQQPPEHVTDNKRDMSQPVTVCKGEKKGEGELTSKTSSSSSQASTEVGAGQQRDDDDRHGKRETEIATLLRQHGLEATPTDAFVQTTWAPDPRVTDDVLLAAITKAKRFKPDEDIPLAYLDKAVQSVLQKLSAPTAPVAASAPPAPARKPQGLDPKGTDESYEDWQSRVTAHELAQRNGGKAA